MVTTSRQGHHLQKSWQMAGYDSAFAPAGAIGRREENCVLDPSRLVAILLLLQLILTRTHSSQLLLICFNCCRLSVSLTKSISHARQAKSAHFAQKKTKRAILLNNAPRGAATLECLDNVQSAAGDPTAVTAHNSCTKYYLNKQQILVSEYKQIATSIPSKARQADSRYERRRAEISNLRALRQLRRSARRLSRSAHFAAARQRSCPNCLGPALILRAGKDPSYRDHGQGGRVSRTQAA